MPYIENFEEIIEQSKNISAEKFLNDFQPGKKIKIRADEIRSCCPVHEGNGEENFAINLTTHNWICHSNGCKGTNLIDLYAQVKRIKFNEAVKEFAQKYVIKIKYKKSESKEYTPEEIKNCWDNASIKKGDLEKDSYFSKKKLFPPSIARFGKNPSGFPSILIPYTNIDGKLRIILSINKQENEYKKYEYKIDKTKEAAFALLGEFNPEGLCYVGEGIATVQTAWEANQKKIPAVSCRSWINIFPVITAIKEKYPNLKLVVLIDCDKGGKGLEAAKQVKAKFKDAIFRKPSFEKFQNISEEVLTDFNDIISKCGQPLDEVLRQLENEYELSKLIDEKTIATEPQARESNFYDRLGKIIGDTKFTQQLNERSYSVFEKEHKRLFSSGGLITGYEKIDEQLYFAKGDFVVVQAMSNHGKSTFMLQLAYRFISEKENKNKDPMCIFITYESIPIRIEEKLINIIGHACENDTPIKYSIKSEEKYSYPDMDNFQLTQTKFNDIQKHKRMHILKSMPLENLEPLIDLYKAEYPERTLILLLDYFQIIDTTLSVDGWERIKLIAYKLESLAIEKEVVIISACQVNENRQTREGRDIYNAATTVLDVFNHSHASLINNKDLKNDHKPQQNGKNVCTLSVVKQKHGSSFNLPDYFLFNGYSFEVKESKNANYNKF